MSLLEQARRAFHPTIPDLLQDVHAVSFAPISDEISPLETIRPHFPQTFDQPSFRLQKIKSDSSKPLLVGLLFSGGPASGGHNVVTGLFDALQEINSSSKLFGFLGGIEGLLQGTYRELTKTVIAPFRNQGGFDLIGTGRGKIETPVQLETVHQICQQMSLDGLVIVGGDDSNTNGAIVAEYLLQNKCFTRVVGIPKTIDGDLRSSDIEISFGFDTACKTYAEVIGNIARDCISAKKYYHFIKLMGRSASHICLECALKVQPNLALIGEERRSFADITTQIADLICARAELQKDYGIILLPEGLIEFIPEMAQLIGQLNQHSIETLPEPERTFFATLPLTIQQRLLDKDPHGNIKLSQINTEELLIEKVTQELKQRPSYQGTFTPVSHFFGYEGRCAYPSNFDANYGYALGRVGALAIRDQLTGVICSLQHLAKPATYWSVTAVPIVRLIHFEMRKTKQKPVIAKYLVDLKGAPFSQFAQKRKQWELEDSYQFPGPIQLFGPASLTDSVPHLLTATLLPPASS